MDRAAALADHAAHRLGEELGVEARAGRVETTVQSSETSGVSASANAATIDAGDAAVGRPRAGPRRRATRRRCAMPPRITAVATTNSATLKPISSRISAARPPRRRRRPATAPSAAACRRSDGRGTAGAPSDGGRDDRAVGGPSAAGGAASPAGRRRRRVRLGLGHARILALVAIDHQIRIWRLITARAAMLTTSVTAKSTRPEAIRALTVDARGLGEVERDVRRDRRRVARS